MGLAERAEEAADRRLNLWFADDADRFTLKELQEAPPPLEFIIEQYLPSGCAAVLTAAGGTSKTGLMSVMAISVCVGLPFFGQHVQQGSVLHISAEDRRSVFQRHVYSNSRQLSEIELLRLSNNLFVKDVVGLGFKLTRHVDGQTDVAMDIGQLIEFANDIPNLRLITLDTLSRLNGGEETNEDLARFVEAMERIARETKAAILASHHSGKAQMRADSNDQYAGRGGSSLSDNARSVMHMAKLTADTTDAPSNGGQLIADGRLLRLSHVKSNYAASANDVYLERIVTPHAAQLCQFEPVFTNGDAKEVWEKLKTWFLMQNEVQYPTSTTVDSLGKEFGSRAERRRAINWATDRGQLVELTHPNPKAARKVYYALPSPAHGASGADYRRTRDGE